MGDEFLGERRKALEEAYFVKHNRALIQRLRAANETNPTLPDIAEHDEIDRQIGIGGDSKSRAAFSLAPLVAMAWADGDVDDAERSLVLSWAAELGLNQRDASHQLVESWLAKPPTPELLVAWSRDYVGELSLALSQEAKRELKLMLQRRARAVAQAAGPFSGIGHTLSSAQQAVMEEIEKALSD